MRKNQASQTIGLAVGLVAALGFLGHTMLSPRPVASDAKQSGPSEQAARPSAIAEAAPALLPLKPAVAVIARPELIELTAEQAKFVSSGSVTPAAQAAPASAAVVTAVPATVNAASLPGPMPLPPAPVLSLDSPPPPPARSKNRPSAAVAVKPKNVTRDSVMRVSKPEPSVASKVVSQAQAPVTQWEEVKGAATVEKAEPAPAAATKKPAPAVSISQPFSKDEMTVTISGDKAWVQVSPTQTMTARKGDVLPNLGKILEIKSNQVVAEKGILNTH